ncbi:MAG: TraB/GumN family protein [Muribaculaceae bacterium]|nr:TraB/GumN family protein [Muribaculaceae bacterium]
MKRSSFILLFLLSVAIAHASLLWKISAPGSDKASYIFGSHHFASPDILAAYPSIDSLIASSQLVVGEISPEELAAAQSGSISSWLIAPADSTLSKVLDASTYALLDSIAQSYGLGSGAAIFEMFKPAAVQTQLALLSLLKDIPELAMSGGIDEILLAKAVDAGIPVAGLETAAFQAEALFGNPIARQAEDFKAMLAKHTQWSETNHHLYDLYTSGDIEGMYSYASADMSEEEHSRLIVGRNAAWISFLLGLIPTTSVFIVVGAGHLGGDRGLISLLRNNGYNVTPIQPTAL